MRNNYKKTKIFSMFVLLSLTAVIASYLVGHAVSLCKDARLERELQELRNTNINVYLSKYHRNQ